jgi:hypothetical protein
MSVLDADPAVISLAWTNESARREVEAFIEVARRIAALGPHTMRFSAPGRPAGRARAGGP